VPATQIQGRRHSLTKEQLTMIIGEIEIIINK
jgi:hypothetical protein